MRYLRLILTALFIYIFSVSVNASEFKQNWRQANIEWNKKDAVPATGRAYFATDEPVVAGQFYPAGSKALEKEVLRHVDREAKKEKALGCVSPHAGYMYSGAVQGAVLSRIRPASTYIIIGPNHSGKGEEVSGVPPRVDFQYNLGDDHRVDYRTGKDCDPAHKAEDVCL